MSGTRAAGDRGERAAAEFLKQRGCEILAAQWRCRYGELDLVAVTSVERSDLLYKKEQFFAFWQSSGVKLVLAVTFMLAGIVILRLLVFRKKRRPRAGAARSRGNYRGTRMR